jgi:hypothetical protein
VFVRTVHGTTITVSTSCVLSTEAFLTLVRETTQISMASQRVSFSGKQLEPGHMLADYGIENRSTMQQAGRSHGGMQVEHEPEPGGGLEGESLLRALGPAHTRGHVCSSMLCTPLPGIPLIRC